MEGFSQERLKGLEPSTFYYEVDEVEALARACEEGAHRRTVAVTDEELAAREAEDRQDAEAALAGLARLGSRDEFTSEDDYVVCNRWGRRLDPSALRRRYYLACEVAGLRRVKLHGLRHAAGSILARTADPVFVRDYLGHSKLTGHPLCCRRNLLPSCGTWLWSRMRHADG